MSDSYSKIVLASTGGSGTGYLLRYFYHIQDVPGETHWVASENFFTVLESEFPGEFSDITEENIFQKINQKFGKKSSEVSKHVVKIFNVRDLKAPPSSGSVAYDSMVILPCSMKTLGSISSGVSANLIERAADVSLKENRKCILVVRESPYNLIHINNMKTFVEAGGTILPASPGFYQRPESINDIYDFIVDRIFTNAGINKRVITPWGSDE